MAMIHWLTFDTNYNACGVYGNALPTLLQKACQQINLPPHLTYYFGLFMMKKTEESYTSKS